MPLRIFFFLALFTVLTCFVQNDAQAQKNKIFLLDGTTKTLPIGPNFYQVEAQESQNFTLPQILKLFRSAGVVQDSASTLILKDGKVLYLGSVVKNLSDTPQWTVSLEPTVLFPRLAPKSFEVYDAKTAEKIAESDPYSWSAPISITPRTSRFIVLKITGGEALSSLLSPHFSSTSAHDTPQIEFFSILIMGLLFIAFGFAIIRLILDVSKSSVFYVISVVFVLLPYLGLYFMGSTPSTATFAVICISLSLIAYAKGYGSETSQELSSALATRLCLISAVTAVLGLFAFVVSYFIVIPSATMFLQLCFVVLTVLTTALLCLASFLNIRMNSRHFAIFVSALLLFGTTCAAVAVHIGSIDVYATYLELPLGSGIAVLISTILMSFATFRVNEQTAIEESGQKTIRKSDPLTEKVRDIRENYDHERLLKVLERERAAMQALQTRESSQVDAMRQAKAEAEEANNAKSAFLAMVSHEIRTPMTGILGMVRFLKGTSLDAQQKDYVDTIGDSGSTIMDLLNDILDFEKIETGQMSLEEIDFSVADLMSNIFSLAKGYAGHKDLELVLDLGDKLPTSVKGDPTRLRQVVLNLTNNAIKFTNKGHVRLHAKLVTEEDSKKNDHKAQIYFAVEDTGIGISPEAQRNLFTPFKQADTSTSRKYGGTGLGLAISQKLVNLMGGNIGINSTLNQGSTFFFMLTLPIGEKIDNVDLEQALEEQNEDAETEALSLQASNNKKNEVLKEVPSKKQKKTQSDHFRALIVDDNDITKKVISGFIEPSNFLPVLAASGQAALDLLNADNGFDVIFMDIEMPNMSGLEATEKIRTELDAPAKDIPIIALTGNTRPGDINACLTVGMNDFLAKPIDADALEIVLQKIKDGAYKEAPKTEDAPIAKASSETTETPAPKIEPDKSAIENAAIFDEAQIASLKKALSGDDLDEMMQDLHAKSTEIIAALEEAHQASDHEKLRAKGHELKGMAGNFGLMRLSKLAALIEETIRNESPLSQEEYAHIIEDTKIALEEGYHTAKNWLAS